MRSSNEVKLRNKPTRLMESMLLLLEEAVSSQTIVKMCMILMVLEAAGFKKRGPRLNEDNS